MKRRTAARAEAEPVGCGEGMTQSVSRRERTGAVLVVEDDPLVRASGIDMFADLGLRVYGAYSGAQALHLLREKPHIRLVFTDVCMPGMDGASLAREIARLHPDVKVVLTSGYVGSEQVAGLPFVPKPWNAEAIAALATEV